LIIIVTAKIEVNGISSKVTFHVFLDSVTVTVTPIRVYTIYNDVYSGL